MSFERRCDRCMWWVTEEDDHERGECRGGPPSVMVNDTLFRGWLITRDNDWCGAFRYGVEKPEEPDDHSGDWMTAEEMNKNFLAEPD